MTFIEYIEINTFRELQNQCWGGAIQRLDEIEELGIEDEFMDYLEQGFMSDEPYTLTDLNDFIWFECDDWIEEHKECDDDE